MSQKRLDDVAAELKTVKTYQVDVTNAQRVRETVESIEKESGSVYVLVSKAGIFDGLAWVDSRGMGLSDKPRDGFDARTPANDMFSLMDVLGHKTFSLAGHDVGMWIAFAMAAERPWRITRVALGEAIIPGVFPTPSAIPDDYK